MTDIFQIYFQSRLYVSTSQNQQLNKNKVAINFFKDKQQQSDSL